MRGTQVRLKNTPLSLNSTQVSLSSSPVSLMVSIYVGGCSCLASLACLARMARTFGSLASLSSVNVLAGNVGLVSSANILTPRSEIQRLRLRSTGKHYLSTVEIPIVMPSRIKDTG